MGTNIEIYELIGAIANLAAINNMKFNLPWLAGILTMLDVESHGCDHYSKRPDDLIRKAYDYFINKNDHATATNIKNTFLKKDGTPVVP